MFHSLPERNWRNTQVRSHNVPCFPLTNIGLLGQEDKPSTSLMLCIRARLKSCRKNRKMNLGFSPCGGLLGSQPPTARVGPPAGTSLIFILPFGGVFRCSALASAQGPRGHFRTYASSQSKPQFAA
jgi:hypothetical protein